MLAKGDRRFFAGFCAGLAAALFVASFAATSFVLIRGLRFRVDREELALAVKERTRQEALKEFPDVLLQIEEEVPVMVQDMVPGKISLDFGPSRVEVPPAVIAAMRQELGKLTRDSLRSKLQSVDLNAYADKLADMAYDLVKTTLETEVNGRTFHLRANKWMSIPVTVQAQ